MRKLVLYRPHKDNSILEQVVYRKDYSSLEKRQEVHDELLSHCEYYNGLGLAANQIGMEERAFIIYGTTYFNPEIIEQRGDTEPYSEGCLSFLSITYPVQRYHDITVSYMTLEGEEVTEDLTDLNAVAFAHELDHLNGITMIDRITSSIQKKRFMEKYKKQFKKVK